MRRIAGGVVGWLAAVLPLLGVNIAGYANVFDTGTAVVAGAAALLGGILLGGVVTGLMGGRPIAGRAGGASATLPAGIAAALLYAISLIAVVEVAIHTQAAPAIVAEHPLRITGAIVCLGAILLGMSLLVGMLVGRLSSRREAQPAAGYASPSAQQSQSQARPRYGATPSQPARAAYQERGDYGAQGRGYNGYDQRQPAPQRSGTPSRPQTRPPSGPNGPSARYSGHSGQGSERGDDWRDERR